MKNKTYFSTSVLIDHVLFATRMLAILFKFNIKEGSQHNNYLFTLYSIILHWQHVSVLTENHLQAVYTGT
jgi:hypothetical protein